MLETSVNEAVMLELERAAASDDYNHEMMKVVKKYEGRPFYQELLANAKILYLCKEHSEEKHNASSSN